MEGHCFWMPTAMYQAIVSGGIQDHGNKSNCFQVPSQYCTGPLGNNGQCQSACISVQVAFVSSEWTLVFVDHNVMISFHVMALKRQVPHTEIQPGGKVWLFHSLVQASAYYNDL